MDISNLDLRLESMTVYRGVPRAPVISELRELVRLAACNAGAREICAAAAAAVYAAAIGQECAGDISKAFWRALVCDDNKYAESAAFGAEISEEIKAAALRDLHSIIELMRITPEIADDSIDLPRWRVGKAEQFKTEDTLLAALNEHYLKNGYGIVSMYSAFKFEGGLVPITRLDTIRFSELKSYDGERASVRENTEAFIKGQPAQNVLLYGDRGTGKSATVHALLNEYAPQGLRMVEISKRNLPQLSSLIDILSRYANKFIIFIDDLSLTGDEAVLSDLKAVLEGSLEKRPGNILVYATSNRRHLVKEFADEEYKKEVNEADSKEELLSLSDRFGLTVTFFNPNLRAYREIVLFLAEEQGIGIDKEVLLSEADKFALSRGVRSPRTAQQFIEYVKGRLHMGLNI